MTVQLNDWEGSLLAMAREAARSFPNEKHSLVADSALVRQAYALCAGLTARHSRTFSMAARLLPPEERRAVHALYAFCRKTDDLVDCPPAGAGDAFRALQDWRWQSLYAHPAQGDDLVALAWADTRQRYNIPRRCAEDLIEGVYHDLRGVRYPSFAALAVYCYRVASTVGLMYMHITGFHGEEALAYAVKLGVALQLTNILRDVGEDWRNGRLYLPQEELDAFGIDEADIERGAVDRRWRAFMRMQIERTRRLYAEACPGIALLAREGRLAVAAAAAFYRGILDDIQAHDYDVFHRRACVSAWGKLRRLPGAWCQSRRAWVAF
ncbi:MAG: squalene/phytoene synthase family protein [Anaerolineaceae bacterium]|nr:squalene/phytoene synthase family protein [Anaerolineaceae bacterium]